MSGPLSPYTIQVGLRRVIRPQQSRAPRALWDVIPLDGFAPPADGAFWGGGGGAGHLLSRGGDLKVCAPRMAPSDFPVCKFRVNPRCSLWSGGGGWGGGGGNLVFNGSKEAMGRGVLIPHRHGLPPPNDICIPHTPPPLAPPVTPPACVVPFPLCFRDLRASVGPCSPPVPCPTSVPLPLLRGSDIRPPPPFSSTRPTSMPRCPAPLRRVGG